MQAFENKTNSANIVAIVEDEMVLREEIAFQLQHFGFNVETFENAAQLYRRLAVADFDVVILDIGLEGEDGLSVCQYLRQHNSQLGIVFATARARREERLLGLDSGADAYMIKPIDVEELILILKRLMQRSAAPVIQSTPDKIGNTAVGNWYLDGATGFLTIPDGTRIRLSLSELQLLNTLMKKAGEPAVHNELSIALGIMPEDFNKHRIEVILSRLRDKIKRETGSNLPIVSKRGLGYVFSLDPNFRQP